MIAGKSWKLKSRIHMVCPYCEIEDHRGKIHLHLLEGHNELVHTGFEADRSRMFYYVECPECKAKIERTVKPRGKDPGFLEEYEREIKLVAFDMLLNHIEAMHPKV